ncbi:MAG: hotdog fold domain-containing protein [Woeseia sp.]
MHRLPFGAFLFNRGIGLFAPFFGKIRPRVLKLEPSLCVVEMQDRRGLRNHIGTINAGALCTLAELVGGMALDATIPKHLRWIPRAMTVQYLAKARGTLTATCRIDPQTVVEGDVVVPLGVRDSSNVEVFSAAITFYVSKRKRTA